VVVGVVSSELKFLDKRDNSKFGLSEGVRPV
jgi:hypothetical protein